MIRAIFAFSVIGLVAGCASKGDVEALRADIAALSEKLDTISASGGASGAQANAAQAETAARELYNEARTLHQQGKSDEAKAFGPADMKIALELHAKYGATYKAPGYHSGYNEVKMGPQSILGTRMHIPRSHARSKSVRT